MSREPALGRGERWILAAMLAVQLVPLWSVPLLPTQDGPIHLEIAAVMRRLLGAGDGVTERYFRLDTDPEPNWLIYPPLALAFDAVSPPIAEKLLLSAYAAALPLAALYAARAIAPGGGAAAFLALPFVFNYPLHMGFYNFACSLPLFFVSLGWWWRRRTAPGAAAPAGLAALLLLVFAAHPVTWTLTLMLLATIALWDLVLGRRLGDRPGAGQVARLGLAAAPSVALMVAFLGDGVGEMVWLPLTGLVKHLLLVYSLVSYRRLEIAVSVATGLLLVALVAAALHRRRRPEPHDALLLAAALFVLVYFVAPLGIAGGGYVNQRVQLFVFLVLLPWLAGEPLAASQRRLLVAAGVALALAGLALHAVSYRRFAQELNAYQAAAREVPAGSTVLPLSFAHRGERSGRPMAFKVMPFQNAIGYTAAVRSLVDLGNYQATQDYFPVVYRGECDPLLLSGGADTLASEEPRPRLDGYAGRPGCTLDYVLLWVPGTSAQRAHSLRVELRRHGFQTVPLPARVGGRAELWRGPGTAKGG